MILATNGDESYAIHLYEDDMIGWGSSGGTFAQAGLSCGDMALSHPASGTSNIVNIDDSSNAKENGKYVYSLTDLQEPLREFSPMHTLACNALIYYLLGISPNPKVPSLGCKLSCCTFKILTD